MTSGEASPAFQGENLEANMRIVAKLGEIAEEKEITPAQLGAGVGPRSGR